MEQTPEAVSVGNNSPKLPAKPYLYDTSNFNKTNERVTLGRVLFYDKTLSFNNSISCGSCHKQALGFADNVRFHKGVYGNDLKRNTLSISGNSNQLFWDGRSTSLTDLVLRPLANHDEMLQDLTTLPEKLKLISYYKKYFFDAYGDSTITLKGVQESLALFCEKLAPVSSKFDKEFLKARGNIDKGFIGFTPEENKGLALFFGKATCSNCHLSQTLNDIKLSDFYVPSVENIGLEMEYRDNGMGDLKHNTALNGIFKAPNLKNIALTAPYMHDGRFQTLEEVINHYNNNIVKHPNLSNRLLMNTTNTITRPIRLNLNEQEVKALVAFLKTLTDEQLTHDNKFSDPF